MASHFSPTTTAPASTTEQASGGAPGAGAGARPVGRRPSLPGGRALLGAALVVAAAVLTYSAYLGATATSSQTYVVAAHDLRADDRITAGDLRVVTGELPAEVAGRLFGSPAELDDAVVLAPLDAQSPVPRSAVVTRDDAGDASDAYEVSFTAPGWKLGAGRLQRGELIDIVARGEDRDGNRTSIAPVQDVRVVDLTAAGGGLGSASEADVVVTVTAPNMAAYLAIVNAVGGEFWVVRATRSSGAAPAAGATATTPTFPPGIAGPSSSLSPSTTRR